MSKDRKIEELFWILNEYVEHKIKALRPIHTKTPKDVEILDFNESDAERALEQMKKILKELLN